MQLLKIDGPTGILFSGGVDSGVLLWHLSRHGKDVQPIYVRCNLWWEEAELAAAHEFVATLCTPSVRPLVVLDLPVGDLYGNHWSITGRGIPDDRSAAEAVFLPGRNILLTVKAALWCQLHGIPNLAVGILGTNPFPDGQTSFFEKLQDLLCRSVPQPVQLMAPLAKLNKKQVLGMAVDIPIEKTFSCIDPVGKMHCGRCNKCVERKTALEAAGIQDKTQYAYS